MDNRRIDKVRRVKKDRRKGVITTYCYTENRSLKIQKIGTERREIYKNVFPNRILSPGNETKRPGVEQRLFPYAGIIAERRSGKDRRSFI